MKTVTKKIKTTVVISAISFILLVVVVTLFVTGRLDGVIYSGFSEADFKNVTFTDAVLNCDARVRKLYGKKIQTLTTDDLSSRFSAEDARYKIFFSLTLYDKQRQPQDHFVNCFVRASNGAIAKLEVLKGSGKAGNAVYDDGYNAFGIKKKVDD